MFILSLLFRFICYVFKKEKKRWKVTHHGVSCLPRVSLRHNKGWGRKLIADLAFRTDRIFPLDFDWGWEIPNARGINLLPFLCLKKVQPSIYNGETQMISSFFHCLEGKVRSSITEHIGLFQGNKCHFWKWRTTSNISLCFFCFLPTLLISQFHQNNCCIFNLLPSQFWQTSFFSLFSCSFFSFFSTTKTPTECISL